MHKTMIVISDDAFYDDFDDDFDDDFEDDDNDSIGFIFTC